jgi:hypothetical protein
MRNAVSRVAAAMAGALVATALLPAGSASAATSGDCNPATSTRLLTGGLFGNTTDHLWVDHPTATRTVVCFQFESLFFGGLAVIVDVASGATLPDVNVGDDPGLCGDTIATLADPVALRLAVGLASSSVCLTLGTSTLSLQFVQGNIGPSNLPVFEVWRDGGANWGWIDVAACPSEWAVAVVFDGPGDCMAQNERMFP